MRAAYVVASRLLTKFLVQERPRSRHRACHETPSLVAIFLIEDMAVSLSSIGCDEQCDRRRSSRARS